MTRVSIQVHSQPACQRPSGALAVRRLGPLVAPGATLDDLFLLVHDRCLARLHGTLPGRPAGAQARA